MSSTIHLSLEIPVKYRAEICVIGAGPSGVAAAVSAARLGKKVILLDANTFPGGLGTAARVPVAQNQDVGTRRGFAVGQADDFQTDFVHFHSFWEGREGVVLLKN